jgi:hypothetical protein
VNLKELKRIHHFLSQTTRPSWHTPPPRNLGEPSHGKLKADQLRSCIEFDVLAAMAEIWNHDGRESGEDKRVQRQEKVLFDYYFRMSKEMGSKHSHIRHLHPTSVPLSHYCTNLKLLSGNGHTLSQVLMS